MRQVVERDKKIQALSLLKFSRLSLTDIDNAVMESAASHCSSEDSLADSMADASMYTHWPTANDANIIYYVSGAVARSALHTTKCDSC